ncbi:related to integral membrane protein [Rhynchosporium secalis]|uniref:Related to integral membrane protein n=1 Tax=Rhynchosporium secalis TaxID=38038 RepID=A0A1E1LX08_RHYSE|nr:related to integral membrane protein [Rhynchosporium secalis]
MILTDLLSLCLRIGELAFSAVVAGLNGEYLHNTVETRRGSTNARKRFIYLEVVAALGILFSLLFLLPFASSFLHWPADFFTSILFIVAFALLAHYDQKCGSVWNWKGITESGACDKFKATMAFTFLAAVFFFVSAILGCLVSRRRTKAARVDTNTHATNGRRKWYRRY